MNKTELIDLVSADTGQSKTVVREVLASVLTNVEKSLAQGDNVALVGFGTFGVSKRAARMGKNPRTGEALQIPASNVPKFSAGAGLKAAVNQE